MDKTIIINKFIFSLLIPNTLIILTLLSLLRKNRFP